MRHVLVVDDDPAIRRVTTFALESEGFTVVTAADGKEALERIAENKPRLVLLDLNMPLCTGREVAAALRQARVDVPIVIMTAGGGGRAAADSHDAAGYLAKPFDLDDLLATAGCFAAPSPPQASTASTPTPSQKAGSSGRPRRAV